MINWYSLPTLGAMLLFWLLAAYVLTRSPRSAISLTAVAAQVATAAYLLGQGMAANAATADEWISWVRPLQWGAAAAPTLWYWLTVLLLQEQPFATAHRYLRWVGYPLGVLLALGSAILAGCIYVDDSLYRWSAIASSPPDAGAYVRFILPTGPLYPAFSTLIALATLTAAGNVVLALRLPLEQERRRRFGWLLLAAVLFIVGANALSVVNLVTLAGVPTWLGHIVLAAAMIAMAWNVAAYSLLFKGQVIRTDFLYFLTAIGLICGIYALFFLAAGLQYSFQLVGVAVVTLVLVIITHALVDIGRQALDRVFYGSDVRHLRANLASTIQNAAMTPSLPAVLAEAQQEIAQVTTEYLVRLTEQALRRLNSPAALADCELVERIPRVIATTQGGSDAAGLGTLTPLERARALRETLTAAIERLKPPDGDAAGTPAGVQYAILREEYLLGLLNKQIMARHSLSEGTFHRNRRQAIETLARELESQERALAQREATAR